LKYEVDIVVVVHAEDGLKGDFEVLEKALRHFANLPIRHFANLPLCQLDVGQLVFKLTY